MNYITFLQAFKTALKIFLSGSQSFTDSFKIAFKMRKIVNMLIAQGCSSAEISVILERAFEEKRDRTKDIRELYK